MHLTASLLAICLVALLPLASALSDAEIQQFASSTLQNRNVTVTDHGKGTLTFNVTMPCRSPCPHFPSRLCKSRDPTDPDDDDDEKETEGVPEGSGDGDGGVDNGSGDKTVIVSARGEEAETLTGDVNDLMEDVAERVTKARKSVRVQVPGSPRAFRIRRSRRNSVAFTVQRAFEILGLDTEEKDVDVEKCVKVVQLSVNKNPVYSSDPSCVPSGMIGFGVDGRPLFNSVREPRRRPKSCKKWGGFGRREEEDEESTDEFADRVRQWLDDPADENKEGARQAFIRSQRYLKADTLLGVALDGFPIYGANTSDVAGRLLNASDLDQCGGRCVDGGYRYHAVKGRKFVLGCIKGEVSLDVATRVSGSVADGKCRYAVSCDAAATAGVCDAGAEITSNFTCIPSQRRHEGSSSEEDSEESGEESRPSFRRRIEKEEKDTEEEKSRVQDVGPVLRERLDKNQEDAEKDRAETEEKSRPAVAPSSFRGVLVRFYGKDGKVARAFRRG